MRFSGDSFLPALLTAIAVLLAGIAPKRLRAAETPAESVPPSASAQMIEQFEKQVRPVLVKHCHACHGPKKQEGDLRLDSRSGLLKGGAGGAVVVPGSPEKSRLITAIGYADEDLQMPPEDRLPASAVAALTEWVHRGAAWPQPDAAQQAAAESAVAWKTHWAAQPVRAQQLPAVHDTKWIASPVDAFILAKLEPSGLAPSPAADRRTLLRRATFDLVGLPPTREEIAAFEQDASPDAYQKVIERLLASPHYGEHWGRHWLDVARYADTKEYVRLNEEQRYLFAFAYRDYVVRAFNADLPYNQFVLEQLAADLLPPTGDPRSLAALGFLTLGRDFVLNRHDVIDDRIDVTTRGLLGLTVTCARCHDHKFDPIPTADYYSLYGIFDSSDVVAVPPVTEPPKADPQVEALQKEVLARQATLDQYQQQAHDQLLQQLRSNVGAYLVAALDGREPYMPGLPPKHDDVRHFVVERWLDCLDASRQSQAPAFAAWHALAAIGAKEDFAGRATQILAELRGRDQSAGAAPRANAIVLKALEAERLTSMTDVARVYGQVLSGTLPRLSNLLANGSFEQGGATDSASPPGWTLTGSRFCILSSEGVTEGSLAAVFGDGTAQSQPPTAHTAAVSQRVDTRPGARYQLTYDFAAYGNAAEANSQTLTLHIVGNQPLLEHTISGVGAIPATFQQVKLDFVADGPAVTLHFSDATANGESGLTDGVLDNVRLVELSADGVPLPPPRPADADDPDRIELVNLLMGADSPTSLTWNDAANYYLYDAPIHGKVMELRKSLNEALANSAATLARAHVLAERPAPYEPRIFLRGDPVRRGAVVPRRMLQALSGKERKSFAAGTARLELAQAIVDPANPLTARVLVNRVWMQHFGTGLVSTPSNFGLRGDGPSHPELLDYLAHRFMAEGWSIKQLHRWIMLSSTYQQSSADRPDALARDPENRWLAKMNRRRLDIEPLRDAMLATSGRLDTALGGPPFNLAAADGRRRTIYGLVDRQNLIGLLGNFDFASPEAHAPTRHLTTVPQQAMFLLNSPFVLEQARAFSQRAEQDGTADRDGRIARMFQLAYGRSPSDQELGSSQSFLDAGGSWPDFAQVLLLSNEFSFVD